MEREKIAEVIRSGKAVLGMEFGSTRIKAVLVDPDGSTACAFVAYDNKGDRRYLFHWEPP